MRVNKEPGPPDALDIMDDALDVMDGAPIRLPRGKVDSFEACHSIFWLHHCTLGEEAQPSLPSSNFISKLQSHNSKRSLTK